MEPQPGYPVVGFSWSSTGDRFLCAFSSVQPSVLDREGVELLRFVRGDMYITDASHTKGHTHPVTGCSWHPSEAARVLTSSADGTLRSWDLEGPRGLEERLLCAQVKLEHLFILIHALSDTVFFLHSSLTLFWLRRSAIFLVFEDRVRE